MNFLLLEGEVASQASTAGTGGAGSPWWIMIIYVAIIGLALYFLMIRPQRKRQKQEEHMRSNVQVGDEILTIGGLYGRVVSIKDDTMVIESPGDHSKQKIAKWAVQQNMTQHDDDPAPKK